MDKTRNVAVIVGSLRKESINRRVANALIELAYASLKLEIVEIGQLPIYNQDEDAKPPTAWTTFHVRIKSADAVLFVTRLPELCALQCTIVTRESCPDSAVRHQPRTRSRALPLSACHGLIQEPYFLARRMKPRGRQTKISLAHALVSLALSFSDDEESDVVAALERRKRQRNSVFGRGIDHSFHPMDLFVEHTRTGE